MVLAAFAATMGWTLATGQAGVLTAHVWPEAGGAMLPALAVFLGAVAAGALALWLAGVVALWMGGRAGPATGTKGG
jgi:hypothetical protein